MLLSDKSRAGWWILLCVYVACGIVFGVALFASLARFPPSMPLQDRFFVMLGVGSPPGAMIGITVFLFTRKTGREQ